MAYSKLGNEYFNSFVEEGLDTNISLEKDWNISNSIARKALSDCLNEKEFNPKELSSPKRINKKENLDPIEITLSKWSETIKDLNQIQKKIKKTIFQYKEETRNKDLNNDDLKDINNDIKALNESVLEIDNMITEILEDMLAISWVNPIITELYQTEKKRKNLINIAKTYSPS